MLKLGYLDETNLSNIGNAIREKNTTNTHYLPSQMANAIRNINIGYDTTDATASASDIIQGKTAYTANGKTDGTLAVATLFTGSSAPANTLGSIGDIYLIIK